MSHKFSFSNEHRPRRLGQITSLAALIAAGLVVTACDQTDTRTHRARTVIDATMDQVSGRESAENKGDVTLESVGVLDRAIADGVRNDITVQTAAARSKFAIGSIIAKPKDIPDVAMMMESDDPVPEAFDTPSETRSLEVVDASEEAEELQALAEVQPMRAMPRIKIDPNAPERTREYIREADRELRRQAKAEPQPRIRTRSLTVPDAEIVLPAPLPPVAAEPGAGTDDPVPAPPPPQAVIVERPAGVAPPPELKKMARRSAITTRSIEAQTDAQSVMLDTMSKYGLGGEVSLSRGGQMVIQVGTDGADPTRFAPQDAGGEAGGNQALSFLADSNDEGCPTDGDLVQIQSNPVLATECIVEDLRRSGQFEYVEKDFIFENQFAKRPPRDTPPVTDPGTDGTDTGTNTDTNSGTDGGTDVADGGETGEATNPVITASVTPNDPLWALQWHFKNNGSEDGQSPGGAGFQNFWSRQGTTGSEQIVVAVVDTGLQMDHPDISASPNVVAGWDMVSDPRMGNDGDGRDSDANDPGDLCDPSVPYAEDSFHGTHVAGTIGAAATDNGSGVAGGAWDVKIVPVRALGKCGGRLSDINDGIRWAGGLIPGEDSDGNEIWNDNPADIINLSIGLFEFCPASLQDAIDSVVERGVVVVSAAGNARVSTKYYAPGGCQNVITVAAGDARGQIAPYSNFGEDVDVLAPGGDLFRDDNGDGRPDGVLSTKASSNCYDPVTGEGVDNCYYAYEQGTSMAAPHVSAALALLKARNPAADAGALTSMLMAALDPRTDAQCAGECDLYPGTAPIPGNDGMCYRPCGEGLLNLANVPEQSVGTASADGGAP